MYRTVHTARPADRMTALAQIAAADGAIPGDAPDVLLPYQQAWIADPAPVKVCEKSRRVGLSRGEASDADEGNLR